MKRYDRQFKENKSSIKFVDSFFDKFMSIECTVYEADYDANKDEVVSKYKKVNYKKIKEIESTLDKLAYKVLIPIVGNSVSYQFIESNLQNGFLIATLYSSKNEPISYRYGDSNFKLDMKNNKIIIQELYIISFTKII